MQTATQLLDAIERLPPDQRAAFIMSLEDDECAEVERLAGDRERESYEGDLVTFLRRAWAYADPSQYVHGWHIDAICEHLEAVSRGQIRRLIINCPPRHMKSLGFAVHWPAWNWACPSNYVGEGEDRHRTNHFGAEARFMFLSYASTLAVRDSNKCRRLVKSPWYQSHWGNRVQIAADGDNKTKFETQAGGYRMAAGFDGSVTGEGGDIVGIDDPHNVKQMLSDPQRQHVLDVWDEAIKTRLNDAKTGAFIVTMQRLHERDLTGHIIKSETGWDHLCLPMVREDGHPYESHTQIDFRDPRKPGEYLWKERIGPKEAEEIFTGGINSYRGAGQLQQRPAPRDGGLFKRAWFNTVKAAPADATAVRGWDLAATDAKSGGDPAWTSGVRLSKTQDGRYFVEDVRRVREGPYGVQRLIKATAAQDGIRVRQSIPQDPGQAGKSQALDFVKMLDGYDVHTSPETGSKLTRAEPFSAQAEAGNVFMVEGDWNEEFLIEAETFPNGAYKDQIDGLSRAHGQLVMMTTGPSVATDAEPVSGRFANFNDAPSGGRWTGMR